MYIYPTLDYNIQILYIPSLLLTAIYIEGLCVGVLAVDVAASAKAYYIYIYIYIEMISFVFFE